MSAARKSNLFSTSPLQVAHIRNILNSQTESTLVEGLTALRNQLTVKGNDATIQPNDERLLLAKEWLDADPGAHDLFAIWEAANSRQSSLLTAIVGVLSALLSILSSHYTYHASAQPIIRALLSQQWSHQLSLYLSGKHADLVLVTLKLYNAMSSFAGGKERKAVFDAFPWETKSLQKLLHMRRKSKVNEITDMLIRPDIRTLYILLVLSFLENSTSSAIKANLLEQHHEALKSIFKGLWQDSYSVIRRVLEVCWSGFWSDAKLKRTLKVQVFSEAILFQLLRIYERNSPEGPDIEAIPADVVHHFLLALCSHPGVGLCFHDRGWYPRETDIDRSQVPNDEPNDYDHPRKGSKIYNKILANILKNLKVNEDPRQQELGVKILAACPELVSGYWSSAGLALEPRLSSKWLANIAFFGTIVSLPVPTASFFLSQGGSGASSLYQPSPPPLSVVLDNIAPTAHIKTHLSRGLQSSSPLVQHTCALALAKCLIKYEQVISALQKVGNALEEDENEGLWARRRRELEREMRKRVPEFQVIVGFSQSLNDVTPQGDGRDKGKQKEREANPTQTALLSESAHRLLWLYHRLLPSIVAEARFDAGKLLQGVEEMLLGGSSPSHTGGLDMLRVLHILRLLTESEHFTWSSKSGSKHSNLYILLKAFTVTNLPAVRIAITALLRHILAPGILFQHDADEITLWLESLPVARRAPAAQLAGTPLTDEGDGVIAFLDDCVQRCVKTPYKYVEDLQSTYQAHKKIVVLSDPEDDHGPSPTIATRPEAFPSPLLATVFEQLTAKLRADLLSASDTLALFSFVRKLTLRMATKSVDLVLCGAYGNMIETITRGPYLFPDCPGFHSAICRDAVYFVVSIGRLRHSAEITFKIPRVQGQPEFLPEDEDVPEYGLIDDIRFTGHVFQQSEIIRLLQRVQGPHKLPVGEVLNYFDPRHTSLWDYDADTFASILPDIPFHTLFLFCTNIDLAGEFCRQSLVDSLFLYSHSSDTVDVSRATRLILHRLAGYQLTDPSMRALMLLLAMIIEKMQTLGKAGVSDIVLMCLESGIMKSLARRPLGSICREGFARFPEACYHVGREDIKHALTALVGWWILTLRESLANMDDDHRATALLWLKYMDAPDALSLLEYLASGVEHSGSLAMQEVIRDLLKTTTNTLHDDLETITRALPLLTHLNAILSPEYSPPELVSLLACAAQASLPLCHDGYLPRPSQTTKIESLLPTAAKRWSLRFQRLPSRLSSVLPFLSDCDCVSDAHVDLISSMVSRSRTAYASAVAWLLSQETSAVHTTHIVQLMFSVYDSSDDDGRTFMQGLDVGLSYMSRFTSLVMESNARVPPDIKGKAAECIIWMITSSSDCPSKFFETFGTTVRALAPEKLNPYCVYIVKRVWEEVGGDAASLAECMVDLGLKWAVRHFVDGELLADDSRSILYHLTSMIRARVPVKSHLAEPIISVAIQDRLAHKDAVQFAGLLISSTSLKPVTANKFLQTVVQHIKFYDYCAVASSNEPLRDAIVDLLHALFRLHPNNTCQPSHIEPLRKVYGGSLGVSDLKLLSILELFESTRRTSIASLLSQWSMSMDLSSSSLLEAVTSLDPSRVLKTCLEYPEQRKLVTDQQSYPTTQRHLYDPVFVLLLLTQILVDSTLTSALAWVQFFRTNALSLVIRTLSAQDAKLRDVAWSQIAALYKVIESADLQEKPQVLYILNILKDLVSSAPVEDIPRLPAYTSLLLAHAFRGIFYPSNFIYPLTARFLLQRPTLDPTDVPMLYGMLYSASDDWKKERAWIIRFLSDGIVGNEEWTVLKRRHTWDLLASLFQSEEHDRALRRGVLEVLANVTCIRRATTSLLLRHGLLAWIEMQLQTLRADEALAWTRILENMLAVVSEVKLEAATNGEWRAAIARCLKSILGHAVCTRDVFVISVPVLLRLSLLPGDPTPHTPAILSRGLGWLVDLEQNVLVPQSRSFALPARQDRDDDRPAVLHHSRALFDPPSPPSMEQWGYLVEALWTVSMTIPEKVPEWDELTLRLLIWRAITGREGSPAGEWARKEMLKSNYETDA